MQETIIVGVLGAVLPPVIDLVNRFVPNSRIRFLISIGFAVVVGAILAFLQYGEDVWSNAGLIFAASQTVYKLWYEKSQLQTRIR